MNANLLDNSTYLLASHDTTKERAHLSAGNDRNARKMRDLRQFQSKKPGHSAEAWTLTDDYPVTLKCCSCGQKVTGCRYNCDYFRPWLESCIKTFHCFSSGTGTSSRSLQLLESWYLYCLKYNVTNKINRTFETWIVKTWYVSWFC